MCGSLRGTAWDSKSFFHWLNPCCFLYPEVMGTYLPGTGTLGWGTWCWAGTHHSCDTPLKFLSTAHGCGTSPFHISTPPTSLDRCSFFNFIVIRLPFSLISDGSEWWLFYILVVISMWLCEEMSCAYLCHHLDWKSLIQVLKLFNLLFHSAYFLNYIQVRTHRVM